MTNLRIDAPLLSKFGVGRTYVKSADELLLSIIKEIENILASRLTIPSDYIDGDIYDFPFAYGIRDLQSVGISQDWLNLFKTCCRKAILKFEGRISNVEIDDVSFDKLAQHLKMSISFTLSDRLTKSTAMFQVI
ncbi:MAG: GPW/gp25 family protein [Holosporales bacterium]|nr:GPW/gp25 family protein [Holosporales bacterium]